MRPAIEFEPVGLLYSLGMTAVQRVLAEALELSPEERIELTELLTHLCDEPDAEWWARIEPEIERREAAIRSGESKTIPWAEVQAHVRKKLSGSRS